jgi:hypothetical protein
MDLIGDAKEFLTGANTAPTPQVTSRPPAEVQPETWQAPDVGKAGHLVVHRDHLTAAADVLQAHLPDIRQKITDLQQQYGSFDCLAAWPQGQQMCQNLLSLVESFAQVSQQTHDAHADTASNLKATAGTYEDAETDSTRASQASGGKWG